MPNRENANWAVVRKVARTVKGLLTSSLGSAVLTAAAAAAFPAKASATVLVPVFQVAPTGSRIIVGADGLTSLSTGHGERIGSLAGIGGSH